MTELCLSPRLNMILSLAPMVGSYCDIGADHGYIAIALSRRGGRVIAMDINRGPLEAAAENIRRFGADNIELRLSDGFAALKEGEADCAVLAGMGGELIARIISEGVKGTKYFVLQPQSLIYELRKYLNDNSFTIEDEAVCREDRRFYIAMKVRPGVQRGLTEAELRIGPALLRKRPAILKEYLEGEINKLRLSLEKIEKAGAVTGNTLEYERLISLYGGIISGGTEENN